jgi:hypothetical protein
MGDGGWTAPHRNAHPPIEAEANAEICKVNIKKVLV